MAQLLSLDQIERDGVLRAIIVVSILSLTGAWSSAWGEATEVYLPVASAWPGDTLSVPVQVEDVTGLGIISALLHLTFSSDVLAPLGVSTEGTLSSVWDSVVSNTTLPGRMLVGMAGREDRALSGSGTLASLQFEVVGTPGNTTRIHFEEMLFNEGVPAAVTHDGAFLVRWPVLVGDVSENGRVTAFDASLILRFRVGLIDELRYPGLLPRVADVNRNGTVTALDASYILQYSVGIIPELPVPSEYLPKSVVGGIRNVWLGVPERVSGDVRVPICVDEMVDILSGEIVLSFDGSEIKVGASDLTSEYLFASRASEGKAHVAFARAESGEGPGALAYLRMDVPFDALDPGTLRLERVELNDGGIAVRIREQVDMPIGYGLHQNCPNPFNAETTICYEVAEPGAVRLCIYTLTGQHLRTLVAGERAAGRYSVTWDGMDDVGRDVASGVYLCRMEAGDYRASRKLVLMK